MFPLPYDFSRPYNSVLGNASNSSMNAHALNAHADVHWRGRPLHTLGAYELRIALNQALDHIKRLERQ